MTAVIADPYVDMCTFVMILEEIEEEIRISNAQPFSCYSSRVQAIVCFRLRENMSSHAAVGRPISPCSLRLF
jgi:hypothetical protein